MTDLDRYNALMNAEVSSLPHGSWLSPEDMQIAALESAIPVLRRTISLGRENDVDVIRIVDLRKLIAGLEVQAQGFTSTPF